jgi:hypothetical protein
MFHNVNFPFIYSNMHMEYCHYGFQSFPVVDWFVCLYNYEFWLSLCKIVRSSVILLLPLLTLMRYSEPCGSYHDFLNNRLLLTRKLLTQVFLVAKLKSSLRSMELNSIKMSFLDTMTPHRSSIDVYLFIECTYSECKSSHVIWYSLSLYAITNKTNKNVQRPHVFLYFSTSTVGTIGAVIGSLIVIGIIISIIVYCAKKSNRSTGVIIHPTTSGVNTIQLSQQQQQQGIIQY